MNWMDEPIVITFGMMFAVMRIYLEVINFDFQRLPLTAKMNREQAVKFHKMGFYFSLGYFITFAPSLLLG